MSRAREFADLAGSADAGGLTGRNLIINGAIQVNQRGTTAAGGSAGLHYGGPDRWRMYQENTATAYTLSQDTNVPSGQGFAYSYKIDVTTADATVDAADRVDLIYRFEGQDLQQIAKGTSSAKTMTLSFWVSSPKTGTHIIEVYDVDNSRQVSIAYTVSAANTWEYKTVAIPADTTGTLDNDNANSLQISWWLMAGSNFSSGTLNTSWGSVTAANRAVGQVNVMDSTSNNFYLTGVQLEVGEQATPFEHRSYGDELARCQRYYWQLSSSVHGSYPHWIASAYTTTQVDAQIPFPVRMRAIPTMSYNTGDVNYYRFYRDATYHNFANLGTDTVSSEHVNVYGVATSAHTQGISGMLQIRLADGAGVFANAEL